MIDFWNLSSSRKCFASATLASTSVDIKQTHFDIQDAGMPDESAIKLQQSVNTEEVGAETRNGTSPEITFDSLHPREWNRKYKEELAASNLITRESCCEKRDTEPAECFKVGFKWISDNLSELLAKGWIRPELFRRGRHKWCIGNWGAAWLSCWLDKKVTVSIGDNGQIIFTKITSQQTVWPDATNPALKFK